MEIFIPDQINAAQHIDALHHIAASQHIDTALARTTHLAVSAHQDDIEFMAYDGILQCFHHPHKHFTAAIVTSGGGSPRSGSYESCSDEEMMKIRKQEQKKAAVVGEYNAQVFLDFPSAQVKDGADRAVVEELKKLIASTEPSVIYTHNLADKHDTHVATALRLITALRELSYVPEKLYGCEVWRGLDWMCDKEKVVFDVSGRPNLEASLLGVFDSQIAGGKRYDAAVTGRRLANATFGQPHGVDTASEVIYAMDLTPLVCDKSKNIAQFVNESIAHFANDVRERLERVKPIVFP